MYVSGTVMDERCETEGRKGEERERWKEGERKNKLKNIFLFNLIQLLVNYSSSTAFSELL